MEYSIPAEPTIAQRVSGWRSEFEAWARTVLGEASDAFDLVGCRTRDCQMGNFMADATLQYVRNLSSGKGRGKDKKAKQPWADLVIINSGGIRAGFAKGNVTVESVMIASPFGSFVQQTPMTGKELLTSLEAVVVGRRIDTGKPVTSFIQVSGLRFSYDSRQYNSTGKPTIQAEIQDRDKKWRKISPKKTYSVVTSDFLLNGGDSIFLKLDRPKMIQYEKQDKVLMDVIKKGKIIKPYLDARIRNIAPATTKRSDREVEEDLWPLGLPEHMKRLYY